MRLLIAMCVLFAPLPAYAQTATCRPHDDAVVWLKNNYDEIRIGYGYREQYQRVVELFVSPDGTWSILSTNKQGRACIRAHGTDWTEVIAAPGDPT